MLASRDRVGGRVAYRIYRVRVDPADLARSGALSGELVEVRPTPPRLPGFPPRPLRLPVDHAALLDASGRPLTPALPLPVEHDETSTCRS